MLYFFFYIESNNASTFVSTNATATSSSQRRKASPILLHLMKITDDEYLYKICKVATLPKEIKVKRDISSSIIKLWKLLERFHVEIISN